MPNERRHGAAGAVGGSGSTAADRLAALGDRGEGITIGQAVRSTSSSIDAVDDHDRIDPQRHDPPDNLAFANWRRLP